MSLPVKRVFVHGFPGLYGGAATELHHQIHAWISLGMEVTLAHCKAMLTPVDKRTNMDPANGLGRDGTAFSCSKARSECGVYHSAGQMLSCAQTSGGGCNDQIQQTVPAGKNGTAKCREVKQPLGNFGARIDLREIPVCLIGGMDNVTRERQHRYWSNPRYVGDIFPHTEAVPPMPGGHTFGCSAAHLGACMRAQEDHSGIPVLLMEDDALRTEWFAPELEEIPGDADIIWLGRSNGSYQGRPSPEFIPNRKSNYQRIKGVCQASHAVLLITEAGKRAWQTCCERAVSGEMGASTDLVCSIIGVTLCRQYTVDKPLFYQPDYETTARPLFSTPPSGKTIFVRAQGRIGNQLFQFAYGLHLHRKFGGELRGNLHLLTGMVGIPEEVSNCQPTGQNTTIHEVNDVAVHACLDNPLASGVDLFGFFQSYGHFEAVQEDLQMILGPVARQDAIGVHVRRGDYLGTGHDMNLPTAYYSSGVRQIIADFPGNYREIVVFSDDPDWCAAHLLGELSEVLPAKVFTGDETSTLREMKSMNGMVITNSTFGWWGAWLADCPTVYPEADPENQASG